MRLASISDSSDLDKNQQGLPISTNFGSLSLDKKVAIVAATAFLVVAGCLFIGFPVACIFLMPVYPICLSIVAFGVVIGLLVPALLVSAIASGVFLSIPGKEIP